MDGFDEMVCEIMEEEREVHPNYTEAKLEHLAHDKVNEIVGKKGKRYLERRGYTHHDHEHECDGEMYG